MKRVLTAFLLLNALGACLSPAALAHVPRHLAGSQCRGVRKDSRNRACARGGPPGHAPLAPMKT